MKKYCISPTKKIGYFPEYYSLGIKFGETRIVKESELVNPMIERLIDCGALLLTVIDVPEAPKVEKVEEIVKEEKEVTQPKTRNTKKGGA